MYDSASGTFGITGALTLDAKGDPNAVFIFKTASTLITGGASSIVLINGAQACNVFWQVGSSATLGTNSTFKGFILALTSVTLTGGASVEGGVLARGGAVTLDTNSISRATCAAVVVPPPAPVATSTQTVTIAATTTVATPTNIATTTTTATATSTFITTTEPTITAAIPLLTMAPTSIPASVQGAAIITPRSPNTGAGGNSSQTLAVLFVSAMIALFALRHLLPKRS